MQLKRFATVLGLAALVASSVVPASAAEPEAFTVTALVQDQVCINGDTVQVTFTAQASGTSERVGYRWDFTNNGSWDTAVSTNPVATAFYGDELRITARVGAGTRSGLRATDTVTFQTLRCEH